MSTESGLPDFRSPSRGLWARFNPDELANIDALETNEDEFLEFYRYRLNDIKDISPHEGHYILAEWEKEGLIDGIVTQNEIGRASCRERVKSLGEGVSREERT